MRIIRKATIEDIDEIAHVSSTTYRATFGPHASFETIDQAVRESRSVEYFSGTFNTHTTFVAELNKTIAGYVQIGPVTIERQYYSDYSNEDLMIQQLYVLPQFQGQGIGTDLLDYVFETIEHEHKVFLEVWPRNAHVVKLYRKYGFKKVGEIPYFDQKEITGYDDIMVRI